MTLDAAHLRDLLARERLVPVLRASSEPELRRQVAISLDAGLRVIEITATSPGWAAMLAESAGVGGVTVGAGTITTPALARQAIDAGAAFLVAPFAVPGVREAAGSVPVIEGAFTPTEVAALAQRREVVKLFPASTGGVGHLRALLEVLPGAAIMPTGGIQPHHAPAWIEAGAVAVGLGSALTSLEPSEIVAVHRKLQEAGR